MKGTSRISKNAIVFSVLMVLLGLLLLMTSYLPQVPQGLLEDILRILGASLLSVFAISFLFHLTIGDKQIKDSLQLQFQLLDNIQSRAFGFGIREMFNDRAEFETAHPLENLLVQAIPQQPIYLVARAPYLFLSHEQAIRETLMRGCTLNISLLNPNPPESVSEALDILTTHLKPASDQTILLLGRLLEVLEREKVKGSLRVRIHAFPLLDSLVAIPMTNGYTIIWDLSFGPLIQKKRILLLQSSQNSFADDLLSRYKSFFALGEEILSYGNGETHINKLSEISTASQRS